MQKSKNNLYLLLGLIAILLVAVSLLIISLFSTKKKLAIAQATKQSNTSVTQTQPVQKTQTENKKQDTSPQKPSILPFDKELAAKIKKVFEPLLSEEESEKLARSYAVQGYHIRILPNLYEELKVQHLSAQEQDKYQKMQVAHQQALQIMQQDRALKGKQPAEISTSASNEEAEFYLPGLSAIQGLKGQPQDSLQEIPCPDRYIGYNNWGKICQEIKFKDGTKSIVYVVDARGIVSRDDFDAQGYLLTHHRFWSAGGYFAPEKIRHIPDYPSTVAETFFYDRTGAVNKINLYHALSTQDKSLQQELTSKQQQGATLQVEEFKNAPKYCDFYPTECVAL